MPVIAAETVKKHRPSLYGELPGDPVVEVAPGVLDRRGPRGGPVGVREPGDDMQVARDRRSDEPQGVGDALVAEAVNRSDHDARRREPPEVPGPGRDCIRRDLIAAVLGRCAVRDLNAGPAD
jgi:hypothetical protein